MVTISAGIIVWRKNKGDIEFFLGTPGGPQWSHKECWNFPKGQMEEGENPFETARREFMEETGEFISNVYDEYTYLGLIKQRSNKKVHVFLKEWNNENLNENCKSNTFIWEEDGKEYPEIGAYKWMTVDEIISRGGVKVYYKIFEELTHKYSQGNTLKI